MASVAVFTPRPDLSRRENLQGFIESARRELQVFGADLNFGDNVWDVTDYLDVKARGNKRTRINFFAFSDDKKAKVPLREPFLAFAKAYCRYMHGLRPKKFIGGRLYALKAVAQALQTEIGSADVERINGHVMDTAAAVIKKRYDESLAYRIGGELELLSGFLSDNGLTAVPVRWRNTLARPSDTQRIGKEFDERRTEKMPSEAALEALPNAFQAAVEPGDVIVTAIVAILLAAPSRISEVLLLPTNCEVTQQTANDTRVLLRWWPSKGAPPMIKPVYSGMSDVVVNAITKLKEVSSPAREIATWYEDHPTQLFLPRGTEYLRGRSSLTTEEVAQIIGVDDGRSWCKLHRIEILFQDGKPSIRFADLERCVLALLPQGFPIVNKETGLRYSNSLVLVRKNELHRTRASYLCMVEPVATDFVNDALGGKSDGRLSMLDRMGFKEPNGNHIKITTHQFRHYLNTIAQMGGLRNL
ncbi:MAG: integrase [Acidobacteria bacterium]|nr:MAG: integrase [Acidobacteriota bacterium]